MLNASKANGTAANGGLISNGLHVIDHVDSPVDRDEVLRYLGYPQDVTPDGSIMRMLDRWVREAMDLARPRAVYTVLPVVEMDKRRLRLRSTPKETEFRGAIGEFLGGSRQIAAFIATAGSGVETLASQLLREGEDLPAVIVNAVGAERAEAAKAVVIERLREEGAAHDLAPTLCYSPGYCGMALSEQSKLFSLFGDETAGVTLTESQLMCPLKSVSGLIGLMQRERLQQHRSPCDRCEMADCNMRR